MENYQKVRLCTDKYIDEGVSVGQIGYIIEVYENSHYEVEFSNPKTGVTIALIVVSESEIELAM